VEFSDNVLSATAKSESKVKQGKGRKKKNQQAKGH
jgi:hypothetical protein